MVSKKAEIICERRPKRVHRPSRFGAAPLELLERRFALAASPTVLPAITIESARAVEGDLTSTTMKFTVTLSEATSRGARVSYRTVAGTAADRGVDFYNASGIAYVRPNQTTAEIKVVVRGDRVVEANETFQIVLSRPVGCTIAVASATGTIIDNDTVSAAPPTSSQFTITTVFPDSSLTVTQQAVFADAARRWSEIITGDLPDVWVDRRAGIKIDDIEIIATAPAIDGAGGILGQAGPTHFRAGARGLPYRGLMEFDSADLAAMEANGTLRGVIIHEMGHAIGLGSLWERFRLVVGIGTTNPTYIGASAVREYNSVFGVRASGVPLEAGGGPGTAGAHWRETIFETEIMSGYAEPPGVVMPISRVTVAALQDLGYRVNYAAADAFSPSSGGRSAAAESTASRRSASAMSATRSLVSTASQAAVLEWAVFGNQESRGTCGEKVVGGRRLTVRTTLN